MKQSIRKVVMMLAVACGLAVMCSVAGAVPLTYFGEDLGLGESTRLVSHPNADAAQTAFLAGLVGVGTETFESYATLTPAPLAIVFPGAGTATLNGNGNVDTVVSGTNGVGRYPISGNNYWEASNVFSATFTAPQAAFGFYGVDIGDFNGQVTLTLAGGGSLTLTVPNSTGISGGSVLYYGVIATTAAETFTSVTFGNTAAGTDYFAFDDMTIGTLEQVDPNIVVPEPVTVAGLFLGVGSLAGYLRRRKHA